MQTLVLLVNRFFFPEYLMRLTVFSDGRWTGQCVPSSHDVAPVAPGNNPLEFLLGLHTRLSLGICSWAVGSTSASILHPSPWRYRHTLVWSIPKIACSVPCVGLSFLRISAMNRACRKTQLALVSGIGGPGFVITKQPHRVAGCSSVRLLHAPKYVLKFLPAAQGRRMQAGLV